MGEGFNPFPPAPEPASELGRYRVLSSTAGVRVSPLQLGGMSIGDAWSSFMGSLNKHDAFNLLDAYYELGGNFIDTANSYQNEQSEEWIGEWMQARGNRDLIFLATKYSFAAEGHKLGTGKTVTMTGNHKKSMHISLRQSLSKLETDYIDLFYVHWWDHITSIPEVMDSLDALVQSGKVLYLGISDTPAWIVSACNEYAISRGKTPFSVYQGRWNIMARDFERDIIPMARHYGMALAPWDVLGGGKFQSKKQIAARKGDPLRAVGHTGQTAQEEMISAALEKVADEHGVGSPSVIALAYVLQKAPNVFPVVGGRRVEHLKANIQALSIRLTEEQIHYLESVQDFDIGFPLSFIGQHPRFTGTAGPMVNANAQIKFPAPERGL